MPRQLTSDSRQNPSAADWIGFQTSAPSSATIGASCPARCCHSEKTEAERCCSDHAFHRQLRRCRILARTPSLAYQASRSARSPLVRRATSALIAAISASLRALRGVRIGSSARIRAGRGDSRNKRSPRRIASSTSCVTSNVVAQRLSTNVAICSRRRTARASSSDANGSSISMPVERHQCSHRHVHRP